MRVLLADDHQIVREGIRRILQECPDVDFIAEAENAHQVFEQTAKERFDVVVLDINLPGRSGLEILKELKRGYPKLPVLVLSMYPEDQFAVRVIRAGAAGYMTKGGAAEDLVSALLHIHRGGKYITPKVAELMAGAMETQTDRPLHTLLSDREFDVFKRIAGGKTVGEIAADLNLSVKTISTYRSHILRKMSLKNNAEIMQYAVANKLED